MKRKLLKGSIYIIGGIVVVIIGLVSYVSIALPDVGAAPQDYKVIITPEKVERGKYLAHHVMMCADCHGKRDYSLFAAPPVKGTLFAGGEIFDQALGFPGRFISSNITPAGIGDWTDGELFRLITTGVKRDGEPIFPVMPYHHFGKIDAEDIEAVIAYIRTLDPIESKHPKSEADFPFNLIMRTIPQKASLTKRPPKNDTKAYGQYLFTASACGDCHTKFEDGKFTGPLGAGGRSFTFPDGSVLSTPNLTSHASGLGNWSEDMFVQRFKMYADSSYTPHKVKPGEFQTIMPWIMYAGMTEEDLKAIYVYLRTLEPVENYVEKFISPTK